jgi:archaellum component FlaF (FlaF/FlaG flagellin family)
VRRFLAGLLLVACSGSSGTVTGIVIDVAGDLTNVSAFTVLVEGEEMTFVPAEDGEYAFPLSHLREHLREQGPIRVGWERRQGGLVALRVEDG